MHYLYIHKGLHEVSITSWEIIVICGLLFFFGCLLIWLARSINRDKYSR